MSTPNDTIPPNGGAAPAANAADTDRVKNLQAEMDRKIGNVTAELQRVAAQLTQARQPQAPAPAAPPKKKLADLAYSDEDAFEAEIEARAASIAEKVVNKRDAELARTNQTLNALVADFPELGDANHELTKKAIELYNGLPPEEKASPSAYKLAVKEAALEIGMKPKSKRTDEASDSFQAPSGGGSNNRQRGGANTELDPATTEFARQLGLNLDDPKQLERLKGRAKRNYNKWS